MVKKFYTDGQYSAIKLNFSINLSGPFIESIESFTSTDITINKIHPLPNNLNDKRIKEIIEKIEENHIETAKKVHQVFKSLNINGYSL